MKKRTQYFAVGFLKRPFANSGSLSMVMNDNLEELIYDLEHVFIFVDGSYLPYFIENVEEKVDCIIKFEEVDNPETATTLSNKKIYITEDQFGDYDPTEISMNGDLVDYKVFNQKEFVGLVKNVEIFPSQIMINVDVNGFDKLIPLVPTFIIDINNKKEEILLDLPEGILDL